MNQIGIPTFEGGLWLVSEAAALARISPKTIWTAIRAGTIPAFGRRGCIRVRLEDVLPRYVPARASGTLGGSKNRKRDLRKMAAQAFEDATTPTAR